MTTPVGIGAKLAKDAAERRAGAADVMPDVTTAAVAVVADPPESDEPVADEAAPAASTFAERMRERSDTVSAKNQARRDAAQPAHGERRERVAARRDEAHARRDDRRGTLVARIETRSDAAAAKAGTRATAAAERAADPLRAARQAGKDARAAHSICRYTRINAGTVDLRIAAGAKVTLEASCSAGRTTTFTRTVLMGVDGLGSKKIKGDIYVVFTVDGEVVQELTAKAAHERQLHAWAVAFNAASLPNRAPAAMPAAVGAPVTDLPGRLAQIASLHDAGVLTDAEYAAKRAELVAQL